MDTKKMTKTMFEACIDGNLEMVKRFVRDGYGRNRAMVTASSMGRLEIVKYLVSVGADITYDHNSAVYCASRDGHLEVVKYLVSLGANITSQHNYVIFWASANGHLEVVKYLLFVGADFNELSDKHKSYFKTLKAFRRWRKVIFRRFFRKVVIPLYYSPGFPGGIRAKRELTDTVRP